MEFLLLGRVEAYDRHGRPVALGRRQERCLLGVLLLHAGQVVSVERLVSLLWEDSPPRDPRAVLRTYVSRLRRCLGGDVLRAERGGYLAHVAPDRVDAHRFSRLVAAARAEPDSGRRARSLADALRLWRGPLLADVASDTLRERVGAELTELRVTAAEWRADAELAGGHHLEAIGALAAHVAEYPLHEPLVDRFMDALHRAGRFADALEAYHRLRTRLADAVGADPGPALRARYLSILRRDPPRADSVSARLPLADGHFTGRGTALRALDRLLTGGDVRCDPVIVCVIAGTAAAGKTALAVHWAHRVAGRFPDGSLYVNLGGDGATESLSADAALTTFLRALGVAADAVPPALHERSALYRSTLSGRRMLVLLDNAQSAEQVRPLLPGSPGCLVLVTSRDGLAGLVARDGAYRIVLEPLPAAPGQRGRGNAVRARRVPASLPVGPGRPRGSSRRRGPPLRPG